MSVDIRKEGDLMYILQKNNILYNFYGIIYTMSKGNKKNKGNETDIKSRNNQAVNESSIDASIKSNPEQKSKIKSYIITIAITLITSLITGTVSCVLTIRHSQVDINSDIKSLQSSLETYNNTLITQNSTINSQFQTLNNEISMLNNRLTNIESAVYYTKNITIRKEEVEKLKFETISYTMPEFLSEPAWKSYDIIADDDQGNTYTAADLINEKILFGYEDNGQEIIFYGQYDSSNKWNGNCLLNVYQNNRLIMINEVEFDHGKMLSYNQILSDVSKDNRDVWIVGKRQCDEKYNSGDSYIYLRGNVEDKDFSIEDVEETDLQYFETFKKSIDKQLIGFYHGNTSSGKYNDTTGQAYLVKFADNGTVKYLYQGMFKDGYPNDDTGNAWDIAKEENTDYMYYSGTFDNGKKPDSRNEKNFRNNLTVNEINEILEKHGFNNCVVELKWEEEL